MLALNRNYYNSKDLSPACTHMQQKGVELVQSNSRQRAAVQCAVIYSLYYM